MNGCNNEEVQRRKKLSFIKKNGFNFPNDFKPNINSIEIKNTYKSYSNNKLKVLKLFFSVAGRILKKRVMGKSSFFILKDCEGEIQLYVSQKNIVDKFYEDMIKILDLGDIIGAEGNLFRTQTGELSINCKKLKLLTKSLKPLPDKFHGLYNKEVRYRKRYLDLISNKSLSSVFKTRSDVIINIRKFMLKHKFLEVETPMIQNVPGGATARPFVTYHNSLNLNLYLRISPELYLKRLIIGGFERIFEINKNFRNEGISTRHNPEFTMMEVYMAYSDYKDMMMLTESLLKKIVFSVLGSLRFVYGEYELDFEKSFHKLTMKQAILNFNSNIKLSDLENLKCVLEIVNSLGIQVEKNWGIGKLILEIFNKTVEKKLIQPTFITDYPIEVSPLSRRNNVCSDVADRFELFISGFELANGFSELNDSDDQKSRFLEQTSNQFSKSEDNSIFYDKDYITALEYGLPPTSGMGIGVDRLIMILTNQKSIRDVILFPILKPI
ncbi:lysine--tRNA ligase [Buchnera aphidicola (Schlechtendalia chinensis)]|uniref:Lysine--tRNA ligase n=1 Tax=Buchnera aphidicola subsp. Schlechtendalia chinensis TaxID=118110 RepID=A0A172WE06_BUCSC|nr:lysine--tRNA ligase [Buchnera aphidicola]ANF17155.1 lysine--tRNA ligase [Buchnera aphidicola (Schlechtendalia chinensis)]